MLIIRDNCKRLLQTMYRWDLFYDTTYNPKPGFVCIWRHYSSNYIAGLCPFLFSTDADKAGLDSCGCVEKCDSWTWHECILELEMHEDLDYDIFDKEVYLHKRRPRKD